MIKAAARAMEIYMSKNRIFLLVITACLVAGVCVGAAMLASLDERQSGEISSYLVNFLTLSDNEPFAHSGIFLSAVRNVLQLGLFLWLCGLTKLGIPIAPGIVGLRGFVCGFTVASLIRYYGSPGLLAGALGILPQMLIMFPCMIVFAVRAMNQAAAGAPDRREKRSRFLQYTMFSALMIMMMVLCALIESYISPYAISWALHIS